METLTLVFDDPLGAFLKARQRPFTCRCDGKATVKHLIESAGPPHTEVGAIRVAGRAVGFDHVPTAGQSLIVEAIAPPWDVLSPCLLRPQPLKALRFVADVNVGKLALLLRMAGLDTAYGPRWADEDLAGLAEKEGRIVLTKDSALLKRRQVVFGRYVRAVLPDDQLVEVLGLFGIGRAPAPFSRCLRCNTPLAPVAKTAIDHRLEPKTRLYFDRFTICPTCNRIFWQGSHRQAMGRRLRHIGLPVAADTAASDPSGKTVSEAG